MTVANISDVAAMVRLMGFCSLVPVFGTRGMDRPASPVLSDVDKGSKTFM